MTEKKISARKIRVVKESPAEVVGRRQVLLKYWELANLDPEATKGTITGQLKALDSLLMELNPPSNGIEEEARSPDIYRSAWLELAPKEQADRK